MTFKSIPKTREEKEKKGSQVLEARLLVQLSGFKRKFPAFLTVNHFFFEKALKAKRKWQTRKKARVSLLERRLRWTENEHPKYKHGRMG